MIKRIEKLKNILKIKGIDSFLITHQPNISYLTGFTTRDSYLFINQNDSLLITDSRYSAEYRNLLKDSGVKILEINKTLLHALKKINNEFKIKKLAFEQNYISFAFYQKLQPIFGKRLISTREIVENLRIIKGDDEIKLIRKAVSITLDTFKYIKKIIKPGIKEIELAAEIERFMRLKGAEGASFDIIVASGPHSSFPHAQKTERVISKNEPILIDMGVDYKGYKSDLTRVLFLGKMLPLFSKVYGIVEEAQKKVKKLIYPGIPIASLDKEARSFIARKGFKNCFKHSLGHGVGLEVHELPKIVSKNNKILKSGMVFTLEPAIYLDNEFGVRIEDMILVTSSGMEVLSGS